MENAVNNLEESVEKANSRLDTISWKLDLFEREVALDSAKTNVSVLTLIDSVAQVKEEYEHLKREIVQVQKLQKDVRQSLHYKTLLVQERMSALRSKIKSKPLP